MSYQQDPNQEGQYPAGTGQPYGAGYTPPQPQPTDPYSGQQYGQQGSYQQPPNYQQQPPYGQPQQPYGQQQQPYGTPTQGPTSIGLDQNLASVLSYVFTWLGGLIIFLLEKQNREVRFHAMQSIIFFGALNIIQIVLGVVLFGLLGWIPWIIFAVGWIVLVVNAAQGRHFKLPLIGDYAERYADQIKI